MTSHADGVYPLDGAIHSPSVDFSRPIPVDGLEGKTVLVTGGASGIGAALSIFLAGHGANVIIGDVDQEKGANVVAKLRQLSTNQNHHFLRLDVSDWPSQVACFQTASTLSPHGGIDAVVANAAINEPTESEIFEINVPRYSRSKELPPAPRLRTLRVDLDGVLYTTTLALSYLSDNPGSKPCSLTPGKVPRDRHLLLVSSIAGVTAPPGSSVYNVAKHGVVGLFRSLRTSAPLLHGVRVNLLCPQYVETPILGVRGTGMLAGVSKTRMEDVVNAAGRLLADQGIVGRGLLVGTRSSDGQVEAAGLKSVSNRHLEGAIWDIYADDFKQSDVLVRRIVALLNLASRSRGWTGIIKDSFGFAVAVFVGLYQLFVSLFRHP